VASDGIGLNTNRVVRGNNTNPANNTAINAKAEFVTGEEGNNAPFDNRPDSLSGNFIIKALP